MKKATVHASQQPPRWQTERAKILDRICRRVQAREHAGQSRHKAIKLFSRRWNGKAIRHDPKRRLALSVNTLYRLYSAWLQNQTPESFRLRYISPSKGLSKAVLVAFVKFAAARPFKSLRAAHRAFVRRHGKFTFGPDALSWNLPPGCFRELKQCHAAARRAQSELECARLRFIRAINP